MAKSKTTWVHVSSIGPLTMCGLGPGAPTRSTLDPLKKNEKWCPRCEALVPIEKAKQEAELRRQLERS